MEDISLNYIIRSFQKSFLICVVFALIHAPLIADSYIHIVTYNGIFVNKKTKQLTLRRPPGAPLETKYSFKRHDYWPDKKVIKKLLNRTDAPQFTHWRKSNPMYKSFLDESFLENLANAKILYLGQYNQSAELLFKTYPKEIKRFLKDGGVVFFDYLSGVTPGLTQFLATIKVVNPCPNWKTIKSDFIAGAYTAVPNPEHARLSILNIPWKISKISAYGYWTKWSETQIAPLQNIRLPEKSAAMIIQEKVLGGGKVIFNSIPTIFRSPIQGGNSKMLQNTLSYMIGENIIRYNRRMLEERGGPGEPVDPTD
jgi:xanthosine utilization system XapX-like protein